MKTLLKLIIGLVIFVLILIFGFLFIISGVNNTPIDLYTNDAINSNSFKDMLALELDTLEEDSALNFHFSALSNKQNYIQRFSTLTIFMPGKMT